MKWKRNMQPIDFSPLHDTLLEDFEGNRQPRDVPFFKATLIAPGTWQVLSDGDYVYVLEGDDEIICVDSGMGAGNIREFCQSLVPDKPLYRVLSTHCHFDHTANNYLFDVAYMSEKSYANRCNKFKELAALDFPDDYPVVFIKEGDVINLKGRPLEVLGIEDHAIGSLQFLDRKTRILFSGDEYNGYFYNSCFSVEHSYRQTTKLMKYRDAFDRFCAGNGIFDASFLDKSHAGLKYILDGHEDEGKDLYYAYEDPIATVDEYEGKRVILRRSPDFAGLVQPLRDAGYGEWLDLLEGRAAGPLIRKLTPDGLFDRELIYDGTRIMYFRNRIWNKDERVEEVPPEKLF
jgi:glyoxylase-like metal-dependent hydrolase (beta-lactamase superfamily II)